MILLRLKKLLQSRLVFDVFYTTLWFLKRRIRGEQGYSQLGEDLLVMDYLPEAKGLYLDVGAGHPIRGSNTYMLYRRGWQGIAVDPIGNRRDQFRCWRKRDKFLPVGIGPDFDQMIFFHIFPFEYSTTDLRTAQRVIDSGFGILLQERTIDVVPVSSLKIRSRPLDPFLLSIDAEGFDFEILNSIDWSELQPRAIVVEDDRLIESAQGSPIRSLLISLNYELITRRGPSSLYVHHEYLDSMGSN